MPSLTIEIVSRDVAPGQIWPSCVESRKGVIPNRRNWTLHVPYQIEKLTSACGSKLIRPLARCQTYICIPAKWPFAHQPNMTYKGYSIA